MFPWHSWEQKLVSNKQCFEAVQPGTYVLRASAKVNRPQQVTTLPPKAEVRIGADIDCASNDGKASSPRVELLLDHMCCWGSSSSKSTMGLFYVWLKHVYSRSVVNQLAVFVNREVADEWWRKISTPPSPYAGHVKRLSPQFYENDGASIYIDYYDKALSPNTNHFFEGMIYASIINQITHDPTIIPPTEVTDHISGQWYFIRSKADPSGHWYLRTGGTCAVCGDATCDAIHVSGDYRTRFCVRVRNNSQITESFVMIGKDEVSIAAPKGYILYINDVGDLKATKGYQGETDLLFSDLKNRFITRAERQVNGEVWEYTESVERGVGEIWELVE